jgi:conjugative transfer signal peptidase TraF
VFSGLCQKLHHGGCLQRDGARLPVQVDLTGKIKAFATGLVVVLLLGCGAIAAGLRFNGTLSFPVGFYLASHKHPQKGDLVTVTPPPSPIFDLARSRGYLDVSYSPAGHLMKRLVATGGDRVTIDLIGVEVNGIRLENSAPCNCDGAGRPLQAYLLEDHVLGPGEVLLMSEYNPRSFDSRYFGPLGATAIESVIKPLLTWN